MGSVSGLLCNVLVFFMFFRQHGGQSDMNDPEIAPETSPSSYPEQQDTFLAPMTDMGTWEWDIVKGALRWLHGGPETQESETHLQFEDYQKRVHIEDRNQLIHALSLALREGSLNVEYRTKNRKGEFVWLQVRGELVREKNGWPQRMAGVFLDITDRKNYEQRLTAQYEVAKGLGEAVSLRDGCQQILRAIGTVVGWDVGVVWRVDWNTQMLRGYEFWHAPTVDAAEFRSYKLTTEFKKGVGLPGVIWETGRSAWIPDITVDPHALVATPIPARAGMRSVCACPIILGNEAVGVIEFFSKEIRAQDDELLRLMNSWGQQLGQFIERKKAEESLLKKEEQLVEFITRHKKTEERLQFLAELSGVLGSSLDYETTLRNIANLIVPQYADWCSIRLLDPDDSIRTIAIVHANPDKLPLLEKYHREFPPDPNLPHGVYKVAKTGEPELRETITQKNLYPLFTPENEKDALLKEMNFSSVVVVPLVAQGKSFGAITMVWADSSRRYTKEDLVFAEEIGRRAGIAVDNALLYKEIRDAARAKDHFMAMLAHELRNPLAPILYSVQLMRTLEGQPVEVQEAISTIERQVDTMSRLLDDLLETSRVTQGKVQLKKETISIETVIQRAVATTGPFMRTRNHTLSIQLPDEKLSLLADPVRLEQIIVNLLNNAAKYTDPNGSIWLEVSREDHEAVITVRDTGIGIEPHMLAKVFNLFEQADSSLARTQGGLGIGLTLVRALVEMHGGTIKANSAGLGQGSEFKIRLPLYEQVLEPQTVPLSPKISHVAASTLKKVLVADDNEDAVRSLKRLLERLGHEVVVAHDGPSALQQARTFLPNVILLDIGLPGMSGYEVAQRLRSEMDMSSRLLVAISGYGQEEDKRMAQAVGFHHHLTKPVGIDSIRAILAEA